MNASSTDAEGAVRLYLMYLEDPDKLVDPATIARLESEVDEAADPVSKLRAIAALDKARSVDGSAYRTDFVRYAKEWAEAEGVPVSAFKQMGVPDDVLVEAGLLAGRGRRRGRRTSERSTTPRKRATPVPVETIKSKVPTGTFTVRRLEELSGGSPATVRKALGEMVEAGEVKELGAAKDWTGRGRAPKVYEKAG